MFRIGSELQNDAVNKIVTDLTDRTYEWLNKETVKDDELKGSILRSPINPRMSRYLYLNSNVLNKCIRAISEDIMLGEISCADSTVMNFWVQNQNELFMLCKDYLVYGYGVAELIFNNEHELISIRQAPAESFSVYTIDDSKYAKQDLNSNHKMYQIHGEIYAEVTNVDTKGTVLWIGGDELYEMFSVPQWYASKTELLMNIVLTDLDINNFQKGNLVSGMLAISGGRQLSIPGEDSFEESQFQQVGTGLAISYIENANPDQAIDMEYINLSNNNYEYMKDKYEANEQSILESFFIPKERLLNNESKESMNSNKSNVLWSIYLRSSKNLQSKLLHYVNEINNFYLDCSERIDISLPTFEDNTQIVIQNVTSLLQLGLMSQKEAVEYLNNNLDIELSDVDSVFGESKSPYMFNGGV
jgi:hypothetical protein